MAAKLDEPVALSVNEVSDSGVSKVSVIVNPTLASTLVDVSEITTVCSSA